MPANEINDGCNEIEKAASRRSFCHLKCHKQGCKGAQTKYTSPTQEGHPSKQNLQELAIGKLTTSIHSCFKFHDRVGIEIPSLRLQEFQF